MKVIHVPFCFYPEPVGGTEVYVSSLARRQQEQGIDAVVAAPAVTNAAYTHGGLPVRRFAMSAVTADVRQLYDEGDVEAAREFGGLLDQELPDLVHLHAFTRAISVRLAEEVKRRGIPLVFTYHTPTVTCQRGTLLEYGERVCDGKLAVARCSSCTLQAHGVPRLMSRAMAQIPAGVGAALGSLGASGALWTALRMSELTRTRQRSFQLLMDHVDAVVAVSDWVRDVLLRNGVPESKVLVSRQGVADAPSAHSIRTLRGADEPLRLAFLGRIDRTKGLDVVLRAIRQVPNLPVRMDIYGIMQGQSSDPYLQRMKGLAEGDVRFRWLDPLPAGEVVSTLAEHYDLTLVPSQWLETGPLVVYESFAAGVPVLGSDLGGIAELVQNGVNGLLVSADSADAWATALTQVVRDGALLQKLRRGIRPPRTMRDVACDMERLYRVVLGSSN